MASKKTIIAASTAVMVSLIVASVVTPLFLSYQPAAEITNPVDVKKFFSDEQINTEWGESYNIVEKIPKKDVLFDLTNYNYSYDVHELIFQKDLIEKNLLKLIKSQILKDQKFFDDNNLYVQVRYHNETPKNLWIDTRWTNKNSYLVLYYNRVSLDIDI